MVRLTNKAWIRRRSHLIVPNECGLHVRAAAMLVKLAESIDARLTIQCGKQRANAKSIMSLLTLGASKGSNLFAIAEGPQADEMIQAVNDLFACHFNETADSTAASAL